MAFLPYINELSDFFLHDKKQSKWGFKETEYAERISLSGGTSVLKIMYLGALKTSEDYRAQKCGRTFWSSGADKIISFIKTGSSSFTL